MAKITAPVKGFNGIVAGVQFKDGSASTDDTGALAYFRRHGYTIGGTDGATDDSGGAPADENSEDPPSGNASKDAWYKYAVAQGKTSEELEGLKRDDIKALFEDDENE